MSPPTTSLPSSATCISATIDALVPFDWKGGTAVLERVLIVTATAKSGTMLAQFLRSVEQTDAIETALSGGEARRLLLEYEYDLVLINVPLPDEFGHELASVVAHDTTSGVMLVVREEQADEVSARMESDGVLVVAKPLNKAMFYQALRLLLAARRRLFGLQSENRKLQRKIEDIRIIDRAKCLLIELRGMTEPEAHAYIEKQAMARRMTRRDIAQDILQIEAF